MSRLCTSIDIQTQSDWEHLIAVDVPRDQMTKDQMEVLASIPSRGNRSFFHCNRRHNNYGHTCRHEIWKYTQGDYILYVDDDDYLADKDVLNVLDCVTEPWAIFPLLRQGEVFLNVPPGLCRTGTGMFIHKREIGRWPDSDSYEADGAFVEELKKSYPYQVVDSKPLVVQPKSSCGVPNAEGWFGDKLARLAKSWFRYSYSIRSRINTTGGHR